MSTDYGLFCIDCKSGHVPDNMNRQYLPTIIKGIDLLVNFRKAVSDIRSLPLLDIDYSAYWCSSWNLEDFLDWIVKHHKHKIDVVDEYGRAYDVNGLDLIMTDREYPYGQVFDDNMDQIG